MNIVGIIPSRIKSTRIPKKALVDIHGLPMVVHVYKRSCMSPILSDVIVATDSMEILKTVENHGGKAIMTSPDHQNGTERLAEVVENMPVDIAVLINGDEPLIDPEHIKDSVEALIESNADSSILVLDFSKKSSPSDFKVVLNKNNEIMYISRNDIPSNARNKVDTMLKAYHILSFRKDFLLKYAQMDKTPLEIAEDHEHLRIIENGYRLVAKKVESGSISVDTPEGLEYVRKMMAEDKYFLKYKP